MLGRVSIILLQFLILTSVIINFTLNTLPQNGNMISDNFLHGTETTDYTTPQILYEGFSEYEDWRDAPFFYYRTQSSSPYYHVVWVHKIVPTDVYWLHIYENSYEGDFITSAWEFDYEWVVVRTSAALFVTAASPSPQTGRTYIGWDVASYSLAVDGMRTAHLDDYRKVVIQQLELQAQKNYDIFLEVPATGDYDLYIYHMSQGSGSGGETYLAKSETLGIGLLERIENFQPSISDKYALLVVQKEGEGLCNLSLTESTLNSDKIPFSPLFIFLGVIGVIVLRQNRRSSSVLKEI